MIYFISGPSAVGKTDCCFTLLSMHKNSVYLDADWFCAKNPLLPLKSKNIDEVYRLIQTNIAFHHKKGIKTFFVALYQTAFKRFNSYRKLFDRFHLPVIPIFLTASNKEIEKRIKDRNRIAAQKKIEIQNIQREQNEAKLVLKTIPSALNINTDNQNCIQIAKTILKINRASPSVARRDQRGKTRITRHTRPVNLNA